MRNGGYYLQIDRLNEGIDAIAKVFKDDKKKPVEDDDKQREIKEMTKQTYVTIGKIAILRLSVALHSSQFHAHLLECGIFAGCKDYAKIVKNQSKPGYIGHEIESLHQKPDQMAFFYKDQANKAKFQKIKSLRAILANSPKSISKEKRKIKVQG
nr:hypothetical protein [Tanacetum cinerariifolium]